MSENGKDGGQAFPVPGVEGLHGRRTGMSLRDYFAAQIAAGDAASENGWADSERLEDSALLGRARLYYRLADAMIAVRAEGNGPAED